MSANPKLKVINNHVYANSLNLAKHFNKRHDHVMRDIRNIISALNAPTFGDVKDFLRLNFHLTIYKDQKGESRQMFNLLRDGFSLIAMGFTGESALIWKVNYINAFNEMETELKARQFHSTLDNQLKLFPEFNEAVSADRPAMPIRFAYEQMIRKGVPSIAPSTIRKMIKRNELEGYKASGMYYVYEDSFANYLKDRKL